MCVCTYPFIHVNMHAFVYLKGGRKGRGGGGTEREPHFVVAGESAQMMVIMIISGDDGVGGSEINGGVIAGDDKTVG